VGVVCKAYDFSRISPCAFTEDILRECVSLYAWMVCVLVLFFVPIMGLSGIIEKARVETKKSSFSSLSPFSLQRRRFSYRAVRFDALLIFVDLRGSEIQSGDHLT